MTSALGGCSAVAVSLALQQMPGCAVGWPRRAFEPPDAVFGLLGVAGGLPGAVDELPGAVSGLPPPAAVCELLPADAAALTGLAVTAVSENKQTTHVTMGLVCTFFYFINGVIFYYFR